MHKYRLNKKKFRAFLTNVFTFTAVAVMEWYILWLVFASDHPLY